MRAFCCSSVGHWYDVGHGLIWTTLHQPQPIAGQYNWEWLDDIVHPMHDLGVTPWVTLVFNNAAFGPPGADPALYASAGAPLPDLQNATTRKAWETWVQTLAARYAPIVTEFEVW
jgi:hypothetical protein